VLFIEMWKVFSGWGRCYLGWSGSARSSSALSAPAGAMKKDQEMKLRSRINPYLRDDFR
jgi:hypothetical protein